jgi:hypothetical protein
MWLTLPTYFATWTLLASWGGRPQILLLALAIAMVYTGAHVYEICYRGHCLLSADSTAAPLTFIASIVLGIIGYRLLSISTLDLTYFITGAAVAFMVGHLLAIAVAASAHGMGELAWMFRSTKNSG